MSWQRELVKVLAFGQSGGEFGAGEGCWDHVPLVPESEAEFYLGLL